MIIAGGGPVSVTVTGLDQLVAKVARIDYGAALEQAGRPAVAAAKAKARRKTGRMAAGIRADAGRLELRLTDSVPWAAPQNFGTRRGVSPNHFLTPKLADRLTRGLDTALQTQINRAGL